MQRTIIRNGRLIDPATGRDGVADLVVERGKVVFLGPNAPRDDDAPTLDAEGCIVAPGLIDPHVHLREPGQEDKETIASGTAAAVNGGFTAVCCMPNTSPALDDDGRIDFVYWQAARQGRCRVYPCGAVTKQRKGEQLAEIGLMAAAGAVGFTDDGDAIASAGVMAKALAYVRMTGRALMQHCEEPTLIEGGSMNAGALATRLGLTGRPNAAEELIIQRDILLNRSVGCRYHVQHLSTAGGVALLREARRRGEPVTGEVAPHHLLLTEAACADYDPNDKMNPPLRTEADVNALLEGVADGTITVLATDHAPHTREEKEVEFAAAPSGIIGLDCALPLYVKALVEPGVIDWPTLIAMMTVGPADLCGLDGRGAIAEGGDADLTIIDPDLEWTIDVDGFASAARNCPFDGWTVRGRALATFVAGDLRADRGGDRWRAA